MKKLRTELTSYLRDNKKQLNSSDISFLKKLIEDLGLIGLSLKMKSFHFNRKFEGMTEGKKISKRLDIVFRDKIGTDLKRKIVVGISKLEDGKYLVDNGNSYEICKDHDLNRVLHIYSSIATPYRS